MKTYCPDCGKCWYEGPLASSVGVCGPCHTKRVNRIREREAMPVGGTSCPECYELKDTLGGDHLALRLAPGGEVSRGRQVTQAPAPY